MDEELDKISNKDKDQEMRMEDDGNAAIGTKVQYRIYDQTEGQRAGRGGDKYRSEMCPRTSGQSLG